MSLYTSVHGLSHAYKLRLQPYPKLISNLHLISSPPSTEHSHAQGFYSILKDADLIPLHERGRLPWLGLRTGTADVNSVQPPVLARPAPMTSWATPLHAPSWHSSNTGHAQVTDRGYPVHLPRPTQQDLSPGPLGLPLGLEPSS